MRYFTCLCHMADFPNGVFEKNLSFIILKYKACHLHVSGHASLGDFSMKILSCIHHKHEAFYLYVLGGASLDNSSVKILCCIFHKHEVFTCMRQKMCIEVTRLEKLFVAYFTHMRLFTIMSQVMFH